MGVDLFFEIFGRGVTVGVVLEPLSGEVGVEEGVTVTVFTEGVMVELPPLYSPTWEEVPVGRRVAV
jgi:hypothetical protein